MTRAVGTFDVQLKSQTTDGYDEDGMLGRMTIDKQLHGDIEGTSIGQMLTAGAAAKGSGAYVAVERVTGSVNGRQGTFAMHHVGVMNRGAPSLSISVVPDSGTGELVGLAGTFVINIESGKHSYVFDYSLEGTS